MKDNMLNIKHLKGEKGTTGLHPTPLPCYISIIDNCIEKSKEAENRFKNSKNDIDLINYWYWHGSTCTLITLKEILKSQGI